MMADNTATGGLIAIAKERMKAMVAEEKVGSDAYSKSLRCYETVVHPLFIERLSIWWQDLSNRSNIQGRTFIYDNRVEGFTGSKLMNYVFQSFYDQEPRETIDIIYPKLSTRTTVLLSSSLGLDMRSEVEAWLESHYDASNLETISLRSLCTEELGHAVTQDLLDNTLNSSLSQSIKSFLFRNHFRFPSNQFVTVDNRLINCDLKMTTKYYASRDDLRAYCSDSSRLRSLVACCLNRLFSPKSMLLRKKLHSAQVLRPDKKDILDIHIPEATSDDERIYLLLVDISNFTGSLANAWLMLYCMSLELDCGRLKDRYQLFGIGKYFVTASWKELLILYIYLTVGVPCWIEELSKFGYLSGGFLGVGGNISIGLLCLALILQDLIDRLKRQVIDYRLQAGGDDIAIVVRCLEKDIDGLSNDIKEDLGQYIGRLKEFDVFDLVGLEDGIMEDAIFCRKRILFRRYNGYIHLTGEPSVPLPSSLFPSTRITKRYLQIQAWSELDYGLIGFEKAMPNSTRLTDTLRQLFLETYRQVIPMRTYKKKYLTGNHRVIQVGRDLVTDLAHKAICEVRAVQYCGIVALSDYESKLRHALVREFVTLAEVYTGENPIKIVMTKAEANCLSITRWSERIYVNYDEELLVELSNIVNG
jgi:hypothetical protein